MRDGRPGEVFPLLEQASCWPPLLAPSACALPPGPLLTFARQSPRLCADLEHSIAWAPALTVARVMCACCDGACHVHASAMHGSTWQQVCAREPCCACTCAVVAPTPLHLALAGPLRALPARQDVLPPLSRLTRCRCRRPRTFAALVQGLQLAAETADLRAERALIRIRARALRESGALGRRRLMPCSVTGQAGRGRQGAAACVPGLASGCGVAAPLARGCPQAGVLPAHRGQQVQPARRSAPVPHAGPRDAAAAPLPRR